MQRVLLGTLVNGDGSTVYEPGYLVIENGLIVDVGPGTGPGSGSGSGAASGSAGQVTDYGGHIISPGLINLHTHGLTGGPGHATGSIAMTEAEVQAFKDRHLAGGTTTALSVDGFPLWSEYTALLDRHPLKVLKCTAHTPANVRAADQADGAGMTDAHRNATVDELLEAGAVCIGEVGAGGTLGGGMQDNVYIPAAVEAACGQRIEPLQARALKQAVLGRTIKVESLDRGALAAAMDEAGLTGRLSADKVIETIHGCVLPSMEHAYEGLREAAAAAERLDRRLLVHHAAASADIVAEVASERLIAGHANHPSFTVDESVHYARILRGKGALLEISGLNLFTRTKNPADAEPFRALVREGLVDFVGTDYAAGDFDPVVVPLAAMVQEGLLSAPAALSLATGQVARHLPEFTAAGLLESGRPADIAVFEPDLSRTHAVYINGEQVFDGSGSD